MPLENLVAERGDDVGLDGVASSAAEFVVGLGSGDQLVLGLAGAVGGSESVETNAWHVGAFALSALLDQHLAASGAETERVSGVAVTGDGVLKKNHFKHEKI